MRRKVIFCLLILAAFFPLLHAGAAIPTQIVPDKCTGQDGMCEWADLLTEVSNFINYLFYLSSAVATFSFAQAGFIYLTSGGNPSKVEKAKEIFGKVLIGFLFVLGGWLIVKTILNVLGVSGAFSLLGS